MLTSAKGAVDGTDTSDGVADADRATVKYGPPDILVICRAHHRPAVADATVVVASVFMSTEMKRCGTELDEL